MTFEERIKKYNYIKVLNDYSTTTKDKIYKIQKITRHDFNEKWNKIHILKNNRNGNSHFDYDSVNRCFIFVTDKYAEERGYHG